MPRRSAENQSPKKAGTRSRASIMHVPTVRIHGEYPEPLLASMSDVAFSRLDYNHNLLLEAVNKYLKEASLKTRIEILTKVQGFSKESAEERALMEIGHQAAGIATYVTKNLHFMFGSMMYAYIQIGGMYAQRDRDRQYGLDPEPITAKEIEDVFGVCAAQYVKRQANVTEGRPSDTPEKWKRELEVAANKLRVAKRKLTYEEAEDVLNLGSGTLKGAVGRHKLGAYWKELKRGRN